MYCRYCGAQQKDDACFCEACGKRLVNEQVENTGNQEVVEQNTEENVVPTEKTKSQLDIDLDFLDFGEIDAVNSSEDELRNYIKAGIDKLYEVDNELKGVENYSFRNKVLMTLTQPTVFNGLRENAEQKKLRQYLSKKIYRSLSYDEIGEYLLDCAEKLSTAQAMLQRKIGKVSDDYYKYASLIIKTLKACHNKWKSISEDTYNSEVTRASDQFTYAIGPQHWYWIEKEFIKMDIPSEYSYVISDVNHVSNNKGCMIYALIALGTTLLAACSLLN